MTAFTREQYLRLKLDFLTAVAYRRYLAKQARIAEGAKE